MPNLPFDEWLECANDVITLAYQRLKKISEADWRALYDAGYTPCNACFELMKRRALR